MQEAPSLNNIGKWGGGVKGQNGTRALRAVDRPSVPKPSPLSSPVGSGQPRALGKKEDFGLHLVVTAASQQGHKNAKASQLDDLLAELIPHSQAGQGAAELAQDSRVVRECCAKVGSESWSREGPGTNRCVKKSLLALGELPTSQAGWGHPTSPGENQPLSGPAMHHASTAG